MRDSRYRFQPFDNIVNIFNHAFIYGIGNAGKEVREREGWVVGMVGARQARQSLERHQQVLSMSRPAGKGELGLG